MAGMKRLLEDIPFKGKDTPLQQRQYAAFYNSQRWSLQAANLLAAKEAAIAYFKPPKSKQHMVSVVLADVPLSSSNADFG